MLPKCSLVDSCLPFAFDWCLVLTLVFNKDELFESEYELMLLLFMSDLLLDEVRCLLRTMLSRIEEAIKQVKVSLIGMFQWDRIVTGLCSTQREPSRAYKCLH